MPLDEQQIKMTARERKAHSDKILAEVYDQLMSMTSMQKNLEEGVTTMKEKKKRPE